MTLSAEQVDLIQSSFLQVVPIADAAAQLFYGRLFETLPEARDLFKHTNINEQGKKLMQTLGYAVAGLKKPATILPAVKELGARHVGYGVKEEHYQIVGAALLWTLEQGLGAAFTDEVEEAWATVYAILAETALAGAREVLEPVVE